MSKKPSAKRTARSPSKQRARPRSIGRARAPFAGAVGAAFALVALAAVGCGRSGVEIQRDQAAAAKTPDRFAAGAFAYAQYCALCHGPEAKGYAADHAPSLVSSTFLETASDELIARGIRDGRPGTAMAPYGKARGGPLDDEGIASIIAFLRGNERGRVRLSTAVVIGDAARGEVLFEASCKRCHGTRTERGNAVHLGNTTLLSAATDAFLRYAIVNGRPGTPMPAFRDALSETEIDDLVAMLRSWGAPPEPKRPVPQEPPPLGQVVINPNGQAPNFTLKEDRYVPIDAVKAALDQKQRIVIIDARAVSDWYTMHIPGSISVPYYSFARLDALPRDGTWITAYCACPHHASGVVVDELRKRGFTHTAVLDEGILEWKRREYPTEALQAPADLPPLKPTPLPIDGPKLKQ